MDAKTTKLKGMEYCKKHSDNTKKGPEMCSNCPLDGIMCINEEGNILCDFDYDFEWFSKDFNTMIKEIYKED